MAGSDDAGKHMKSGTYYVPGAGIVSMKEAYEVSAYVYCFADKGRRTTFNGGKKFKARCGDNKYSSNSFKECEAWLEAMMLVNL